MFIFKFISLPVSVSFMRNWNETWVMSLAMVIFATDGADDVDDCAELCEGESWDAVDASEAGKAATRGGFGCWESAALS